MNLSISNEFIDSIVNIQNEMGLSFQWSNREKRSGVDFSLTNLENSIDDLWKRKLSEEAYSKNENGRDSGCSASA